MASKTKILFETGPIFSKKTGVGFFAERLLYSILDNSKGQVLVNGFCFNFLGRKRIPVSSSSLFKIIEIKFMPQKVISMLTRIGLRPLINFFVNTKKYDHIIYTNFTVFPNIHKTPQSVVIYDLGFLDRPEFVEEKNLSYLKKNVPIAVSSSAFIITNSSFTKQRIGKHFGSLAENKTIVLPIPFEPQDKKIKENTRKKPYILFVGTIEPRKNLDSLIYAFCKTSPKTREDYQLVFVGQWGWKTENIKTAIEKSKDYVDIDILGYVDEGEKAGLYANASLVVLVSHYEGYGMPLVEAMYYGRKLLLSSLSVFQEIAGNYATYCDPEDVDSIARAIDNALAQPQKASKKLEYTWKDNYHKLMTSISNTSHNS